MCRRSVFLFGRLVQSGRTNTGAVRQRSSESLRIPFRVPSESCQRRVRHRFFDSNGQGTRLSKALVPDACRSSAAFRSAAAIPYVADAPDAIRGLGLQFRLRDGEEWRTAMINRPVFMFNTAQAFYDNLIASQPDPNTHKPDPEKLAAFAASHPEFVTWTSQADRDSDVPGIVQADGDKSISQPRTQGPR
jgi:hypothetical protein